MRIQTILFCLAGLIAATAVPAFAQLTLSGMTMWESSAIGAWGGVGSNYYNTRGSEFDSGSVSNVYLFTGSTTTPVLLNSGDSDALLNPNYSLSTPGSYTLWFVGNGHQTDTYIGLNLYFDGNLNTDRISAVVPKDESHSFSFISGTTTTFGETVSTGPGVLGTGTLSYSNNGLVITLTDFSVLTSALSPDMVSAYSWGTGGSLAATNDTVGYMTLTVSAIPESSTYAALFGLGALGFAVYRRGRRQTG